MALTSGAYGGSGGGDWEEDDGWLMVFDGAYRRHRGRWPVALKTKIPMSRRNVMGILGISHTNNHLVENELNGGKEFPCLWTTRRWNRTRKTVPCTRCRPTFIIFILFRKKRFLFIVIV